MRDEVKVGWWLPELEVDVQQRIPTQDPTSIFGFGAFILFNWRF